MSIHRGIDIVLSLNGSEVGFQDSCTLDASSEMLDLTPASGGVSRSIPISTSYTISCSGLMGITNGQVGSLSLLTALNNRTLLSFQIQLETTGQSITGDCYCENWSGNGDATGYGTYSVNLKVTNDINIG